jgi:hypothetical protein
MKGYNNNNNIIGKKNIATSVILRKSETVIIEIYFSLIIKKYFKRSKN